MANNQKNPQETRDQYYKLNVSEVLEDTIVKVAYPSYRVFIFGKEVTEDIVAVRINQAGGSVERSASSCQITLLNKNNKYMLTHDDMIRIGKTRAGIVADRNSSQTEFQRVLPSDAPVLSIGGLDYTTSELTELASKLKSADSKETSVWLQALFGSIVEEQSNADALARQIIQFVDEQKHGSVSEYDKMISYEASVEGSSYYNIKQEVVNEKLTYRKYSLKEEQMNRLGRTESNLEPVVIWEFPMYEGDCIFGCNDPIRIVMRDPFDATLWYWSFTGFIDAFTEDYTEEHESTINLNCTDICKIPRYITVQQNVGDTDGSSNSTTDQNISQFLQDRYGFSKGLMQGIAPTTSMISTSEMFASLNILEILELLFFGSESTEKLLGLHRADDGQITDEGINSMIEMFKEELALQRTKNRNKDAAENISIYNYLVNTLKINSAEADRFFDNYSSTLNEIAQPDWDRELKNYFADFDLVGERYTHKRNSLKNLHFGPVTFPGNVVLRKGPVTGINYHVYGVPSPTDVAYGAKTVTTLKEWNEIIHHRVRISDLSDMAIEGDEAISFAPNFKADADGNTMSDIDRVITMIGTNISVFPVGGGKVHFLTFSSTLDTLRRVMDQSIQNSYGFHSAYTDRLTLLYDMAKEIDFRFYATPKGDFVFEMPFYDFDPGLFWEEDVSFGRSEKKKLETISSYEEIFKQAYDGKYLENSEFEELTKLQFKINANSGVFSRFLVNVFGDKTYNYADVFTIDKSDMIRYSYSLNDSGAATVAMIRPNTFGGVEQSRNEDLTKYQFAYAPDLVSRLGVRVIQDNTWGNVDSAVSAKYLAQFLLNISNSDCRSCSIQLIPRFGMMVNRPVFWEAKHQYANIIGLDHSVVWNSDVSTSVSLNNIRAWNGQYDDSGKPLFLGFAGMDQFNFLTILKESNSVNKKRDNDLGVSEDVSRQAAGQEYDNSDLDWIFAETGADTE